MLTDTHILSAAGGSLHIMSSIFYFYLHMLAYTYTLLSDIVAKKFEHTTHAYALNCKVTVWNADFW